MHGADISKQWPGSGIILASCWTRVGEVPLSTVHAMEILPRIKFDMQWNLCGSLWDYVKLAYHLPVHVLRPCLLLLHTHSEYSITPRCGVIVKLIVAQLLKNVFYGT